MSVRMRNLLMDRLGDLRHEPTDKRIRARLDRVTVVDSTDALLVWEPKRVVAAYAVPEAHVAGQLVAAPPDASTAPDDAAATSAPRLGDRPVYDPSVPFAVHTTDGEPLVVEFPHTHTRVGAFRPADPDLAGYVLLDFAGFDAWYEEDELNLAHPRDPFHRVDILHSSRVVRVEIDGEVVAESGSPCLVFEPPLPVRCYFTLDEVRSERLEPSELTTRCAYKGEASYFSVAGHDDVAWGYREPLRDSVELTGRIAFFDERVDLFVDGVRQERPITPWSRPDDGRTRSDRTRSDGTRSGGAS